MKGIEDYNFEISVAAPKTPDQEFVAGCDDPLTGMFRWAKAATRERAIGKLLKLLGIQYDPPYPDEG